MSAQLAIAPQPSTQDVYNQAVRTADKERRNLIARAKMLKDELEDLANCADRLPPEYVAMQRDFLQTELSGCAMEICHLANDIFDLCLMKIKGRV